MEFPWERTALVCPSWPLKIDTVTVVILKQCNGAINTSRGRLKVPVFFTPHWSSRSTELRGSDEMLLLMLMKF